MQDRLLQLVQEGASQGRLIPLAVKISQKIRLQTADEPDEIIVPYRKAGRSRGGLADDVFSQMMPSVYMSNIKNAVQEARAALESSKSLEEFQASARWSSPRALAELYRLRAVTDKDLAAALIWRFSIKSERTT